MRILGIDPGLRFTGYGCVKIDPRYDDAQLVEAGVIKLKANAPLPFRLAQLYEDLLGVIDETKPSRVVVEQLFSHYKHARTSILMGHARGVVLLCAEQRGLPVQDLLPNEVKKAITGHGHATKEQMQHAVMAQCNLPELPSPPDVADAIGIALCAARRIMSEPAAI